MVPLYCHPYHRLLLLSHFEGSWILCIDVESVLVSLDICCQKKGTLLSKKGAGVAFLHEGYPITDGDSCTYATVRHVLCELIVTSGDRCASCHSYRST